MRYQIFSHRRRKTEKHTSKYIKIIKQQRQQKKKQKKKQGKILIKIHFQYNTVMNEEEKHFSRTSHN